MSPEESVYEPDNSHEESIPKLEKLVRYKFEWRSDELDHEVPEPGARFSKVPLTTGPVNLAG